MFVEVTTESNRIDYSKYLTNVYLIYIIAISESLKLPIPHICIQQQQKGNKIAALLLFS